MGNHELDLNEDLNCDICNKLGAYDVYGDSICGTCMDDITEDISEGDEFSLK